MRIVAYRQESRPPRRGGSRFCPECAVCTGTSTFSARKGHGWVLSAGNRVPECRCAQAHRRFASEKGAIGAFWEGITSRINDPTVQIGIFRQKWSDESGRWGEIAFPGMRRLLRAALAVRPSCIWLGGMRRCRDLLRRFEREGPGRRTVDRAPFAWRGEEGAPTQVQSRPIALAFGGPMAPRGRCVPQAKGVGPAPSRRAATDTSTTSRSSCWVWTPSLA